MKSVLPEPVMRDANCDRQDYFIILDLMQLMAIHDVVRFGNSNEIILGGALLRQLNA